MIFMNETLTQPELGQLYVEMVAPLGFQQCLSHGYIHDDDALAMHQVISDQKPDTALISLGLCGVILGNHILQKHSTHTELSILGTELKYFSIDIVERYGRAWINAKEYEKNDRDLEEKLLLESADNLNAFGSIVQEIHELCEETNPLASNMGKILEYQAYAQANLAESYIDILQQEGKIKPNFTPDPIPVPADLHPQDRV